MGFDLATLPARRALMVRKQLGASSGFPPPPVVPKSEDEDRKDEPPFVHVTDPISSKSNSINRTTAHRSPKVVRVVSAKKMDAKD